MNAPRHPKLFVTDLDGTILGGSYKPYARFPAQVTEMLDSLARTGCDWATATTWEVAPQLQLIYASGLQSRPACLIGGSGLQLCLLQGDEAIPRQPYMERMQSKLQRVARKELYPLMRTLCARFEPDTLAFNGFWLAMAVKEADADALAKALQDARSGMNELHLVSIPNEHRFYAHPAFLRKGTALQEVLEWKGLEPDDVVVAGDEEMDLDMMKPELTKHVICPSNAHPAVKRRVREMDGVVAAMPYGQGVVEAFARLAEKRRWSFT